MSQVRRVNLLLYHLKGSHQKLLQLLNLKKMAMLSNKLEYLARKNRKFLSKRGGYKSSKKEDQNGCFNCKKPEHFIADCPDIQKEKSKEKSKKPLSTQTSSRSRSSRV